MAITVDKHTSVTTLDVYGAYEHIYDNSHIITEPVAGLITITNNATNVVVVYQVPISEFKKPDTTDVGTTLQELVDYIKPNEAVSVKNLLESLPEPQQFDARKMKNLSLALADIDTNGSWSRDDTPAYVAYDATDAGQIPTSEGFTKYSALPATDRLLMGSIDLSQITASTSILLEVDYTDLSKSEYPNGMFVVYILHTNSTATLDLANEMYTTFKHDTPKLFGKVRLYVDVVGTNRKVYIKEVSESFGIMTDESVLNNPKTFTSSDALYISAYADTSDLPGSFIPVDYEKFRILEL